MSRLITFFHIFLDNADSEDKKPFESGDGTAATTFDEDLDNVDMVVEIKASDKVQILKHWRPIFPTLNPLTINCKTPTVAV